MSLCIPTPLYFLTLAVRVWVAAAIHVLIPGGDWSLERKATLLTSGVPVTSYAPVYPESL
jgi:hypothetical protein